MLDVECMKGQLILSSKSLHFSFFYSLFVVESLWGEVAGSRPGLSFFYFDFFILHLSLFF